MTKWFVLGAVVLIGAFGALCAARIAGIERDLRTARADIRTAAAQFEEGQLAEARATLRSALALLVSTNERLHGSPELQVASIFPVASQNLDSLRETNGLALRLAGGAVRVLDVAEPLQDASGDLQIPLRSGAIPLDVVSAVRRELTSMSADLPGTDPSSSSLLLPQVREAAEELADEVERRRPHIDNLAHALTMLNEMTGGNGDRRYFLAVANTAEMRGSGGMYLSYGILEASDGDLSLPTFGGIDELFLEAAVDPIGLGVPPSEVTRWSGLEQTRLWRNINLVPDLSVVGPRLQAMYTAATGEVVHGVIQIDAAGLAALLEGIGPVEVDEVGRVTSENAVALTLNEAYSLFPDRDQRQEVLGDVAEAAFERLVDGQYDSLRPLATALLRAGTERHIEVWAPSNDVSAPAAYFGIDGAIPAPDVSDAFLLTVQNFGRDKLDYYVDTAVSVTGDRLAGEASELDVEVTVSSAAPADTVEPAYVFGTDIPRGNVPPGTYVGIASFYVPDGTVLLDPSDEPGAPRLVTEGARSSVTWDLTVDPQSSVTVSFRLVLAPRPPGPYLIALTPIPRVRPTTWSVDVAVGDGAAVRRDGPLAVPETLRPSPDSDSAP